MSSNGSAERVLKEPSTAGKEIQIGNEKAIEIPVRTRDSEQGGPFRVERGEGWTLEVFAGGSGIETAVSKVLSTRCFWMTQTADASLRTIKKAEERADADLARKRLRVRRDQIESCCPVGRT